MPIQHAIDALVAKYKALIADGTLDYWDFLSLGREIVTQLILAAEALTGTGGADKKKLVLDAFGQFIDQVVTPLPTPGVPKFMEPLVDAAVKQVLLLSAGWVVDKIVSAFNANGWPQK